MYKYNHRKYASSSALAALCALTALGGQAAHAGANPITLFSQLVNPLGTGANSYPTGNASSVVPASFSVPLGTNQVTYTATNAVSGSGFQSFPVSTTNAAPQFTTAPYGAVGDILENTTFATGTAAGNTATGPLLITFQTGVAAFGLLAQDFNADTETFTLNVFNGVNQIGTFTFGPTPNGDPALYPNAPLGNADFVGAQATGGDLITSATLSSLSVAVGVQPNNGNNDFAFGRTFIQSPVPEASTLVSFGLGVLLFGGLTLSAYKRKADNASLAAPQTAG